MLPLSPWRRSEWPDSNRRHRLGRPRPCRLDDTRVWFGLRVSNPSLHVGTMECCLHTQAEHARIGLRRSVDILQLSKTPLVSSWWAARDSNPNAPVGRTVLQTASGPSARTAHCVVATVPGVEPGPASF